MRTYLKHITSITTGIYAKPDPIGQVKYLQVNHFNDVGKVFQLPFPELELNDKTAKHLLKEDDILFAAKGSRNFATRVTDGFGMAVASSTFFVIRLTGQAKTNILPEFLVWSINHPNNLNFLKGGASGTSVPSIPKSVLEELELFIPPLHAQELILQIHDLRLQEKELKAKIELLKEKQIQQSLLNALMQ